MTNNRLYIVHTQIFKDNEPDLYYSDLVKGYDTAEKIVKWHKENIPSVNVWITKYSNKK